MQQTMNELAYDIEISGEGERQALLLHGFGGAGLLWGEVLRRVFQLL